MQGFTILALGAYRFAVANGGLDKIQRSTKWRWASQEVIGAGPALQYVGPGEDTISIEVTIFPHFRGGLGQADAIRGQAGLGSPLTLVDGTGRYYGQWVIESVDEGREAFFSDGAPRKIDLKIELKKYA